MKKIFIPVSAFAGYALLLLGVLLAGGCMKTKEDNKIPFLDVTSGSPSAIRMFNFANDNLYGTEVTINNVPLTSYDPANNSGKPTGTALGLSLFPSGAWNSGDNASPFFIPNSLLDKEGKAHCLLSTMTGTFDTTIVNDVVHPKDYYLMQDGHIKVLERDNMPPTRAGYFKVRVINLGNPNRDQLNLGLKGPVSLTYANGDAVDPLVTAVVPGVSSSYIELPYGSYQFKLFMAAGAGIDPTRQLAEFPLLPRYDYCIGALPQEGILPQLRTFKAGGVYSIVVTENNYRMLNCSKENARALVNSYRVITELDPGTNYSFARMQAVNALPGKKVSILVDGKALGGELPYIGSIENGKAVLAPGDLFIQGDHQVKVTDASGKELASSSIRLSPADHYTIWACEKADGSVALLFEANEMTGSVYASTYRPGGNATGELPDDGTNGTPRRLRLKYAWESRFLNMSPDLPFLTFTNDQQLFVPAMSGYTPDTLRFGSSYINLASAQQPLVNVSMLYNLPFVSPAFTDWPDGNTELSYFPRKIRAYRSQPGNPPQVPGSLLTGIAPLDLFDACIANNQLYTKPEYRIPENGVYTIAVVGRTTSNAPASEKAKIIVIKHNQ